MKTSGTPMVRALFRAVPMAGAASLSCKIYYPAVYTGAAAEKNSGLLPILERDRPYPVAILMPGINISPDAYGWLATALAESGIVSVVYGWILEEMPGLVALSPGLDIGALTPAVYGTRPSASALAAVIAELRTMNMNGALAGQLDPDRILLGGHSGGGSVALFNARPDWFPGLKAVFAYGAHSKASTMLGYPPETFLRLPDALRTLIMGGSEDGVIAASAFRYGADGDSMPDPTGPVVRTFHDALPRTAGDSHLAILAGANHFSLAWPPDPATGRPFLDGCERRDNAAIRADLAALITAFARLHLDADAGARGRIDALLADRERVAETATR